MSQSLQLTIKSSIFHRPRELIIDPDFFQFDDSDLVGQASTKIVKEEIEGLRYGIKWIQGIQFTIGRIYCIDLRSASRKTIKLRLKSFYGIRKLELAQKYAKIVNTLMDFYFDDISRLYLKRFDDSLVFNILGVIFSADGVRLSEESQLIPWDDLGTRSYARYYALFSKVNPNHYKVFEYLNDWNTGILYSVSREILKRKQLWQE
jgi:hypothetical protein